MPETILKVENFTPHPILVVAGLNVKFGKEEVIRNLSFEVKKGEFLIVLGPNGAGKTTLFKAILGLVPSEGKIIWQDKIPKISYLPERLSQDKFKNLAITVKEFFRFKEKSDEKIFSILKAVGLEPNEILNKNPGDLSSGQFQRMLIAWSLISEPEILFFDEPATGIDVGGEETIYSLLEKFWKEKNLTILLVTHDLNIVYKYATNVLCLSKKEVCCFGPPKEILTPKVLEKIYGTGIKFYEHKH
jgi:zinc transport system ATP-binding protein